MPDTMQVRRIHRAWPGPGLGLKLWARAWALGQGSSWGGGDASDILDPLVLDLAGLRIIKIIKILANRLIRLGLG